MAKLVGNPYEDLANAIIIKACNDYRTALKRVKKNPENKDAINDALSLERFFKSPWYQVLTSVDGEFLLRKICAEVAEWR